MMKNGKREAFTLIELMTVVTIISILAAIAIPNFLNATIRAKIARSMVEQEMLLWSLEMYFVDSDDYPQNLEKGRSGMGDLVRLTTPVSYVRELPQDIFLSTEYNAKSETVLNLRRENPFYHYVNFLQRDGQRYGLRPFGRNGSANYMLYGLGPSYTTEMSPDQPETFTFYKPSNGTLSVGSIVTFGP